MKPSNLLKISTLDHEWRDKDKVMLHACFQILMDFVESEMYSSHIDWDGDKDSKEAEDEIKVLYNWWLEYSKNESNAEKAYQIENQMLVRLIAIRHTLWT
ncbi:TPA: hypothetical protein I7227_21255 [Vibrio vulnificus]|nr:hypothetical protein [Vibrio vulnificus]HDY7648841.1 hypothetical protein [Vibrio vulnificus]